MRRAGRAVLDSLIEEATVDANSEEEAEGGFLTLLEEASAAEAESADAFVVGEAVEVVAFMPGPGGRGLFATVRRKGQKYDVHVTSLDWRGNAPKTRLLLQAYRRFLGDG
ncbi:MAG: hypothetical protein ACYDDF_03400 [Thermoplasmatota archaeon]